MIKNKKTKNDNSEVLAELIINAIQEKKGKEIVSLDLRHIKSSVSDYFIVCHAESSTQVKAIADCIEHELEKKLNEQPWQKEGFTNAEWILLDYVNVVVHVFKKEKRSYYNVEELWGDAEIKSYLSAS